MKRATAPISNLALAAYRIPTETPESDGTLAWDSTTLVTVDLEAAGVCGFGYTYAGRAAVTLLQDRLCPLLEGTDALATAARWSDMWHAVRNLGRSGIAATAVSAVDIALWDWKAKFLDTSLVALLGAARTSIRAYGSGGFTSYSAAQLQAQLETWVAQGLSAVKMKVGREPRDDPARVTLARDAIGQHAELFVDANGAYSRKSALDLAQHFAQAGVSWFEEPVSADDLDGLHLLRDRAPPGMAIAAGEYGYVADDFRRLLESGCVDVLQADATRCGITGFLLAAGLCEAFHVPLSSHCAPSLHTSLGCVARAAVHLEYFHDHVRIENLLFDGAPVPDGGRLKADLSRPGLGIELKTEDAACYRT